ncbi:Threonine/homoserine/homoserine lactone efflux protein [Microbulbifer donghaiensis]|uniref:Threonine/homoserine/homoserine lactone efflux protein n=1 Tax=Microbulbifer donghaiensis TaxID=494016 RepID=A0A1M5E949_9GAMM|nr:LysE family translocator [Microbulbifer donghaiensis]SHF75710.1 Threonine/homoserine/homoserine lactone efflux protein [Microbulbifer donghaiensis]
MFGIENLWLFVVSGLVLNILPGPDSLYIVGRSASQGFRAGSAAALGIGTGTMVHVLAASLGLAMILATSAWAFTVVKLIGCAYLLYVGATMIVGKSGGAGIQAEKPAPVPLKKIFYQGFLTNVLNPKVALFFLAFVPQFIAADSDSKALAFVLLGLIFNANGMLWCHFLAWSSASVSRKFKTSERAAKWLNRAAGSLFGFFGIKLALSSQS